MSLKNCIFRLGLGFLVVLVLAGAPGHPARTAGATFDPCSLVLGDPPIDDPEPTIGGTITNASTLAGIQGATVELFQCQSGTGVSGGTTSTGSGGAYTFSVTPGYYYFIQAQTTGPLLNMQPAQGVNNPSAAHGVGPSIGNVNFAFQ